MSKKIRKQMGVWNRKHPSKIKFRRNFFWILRYLLDSELYLKRFKSSHNFNSFFIEIQWQFFNDSLGLRIKFTEYFLTNMKKCLDRSMLQITVLGSKKCKYQMTFHNIIFQAVDILSHFQFLIHGKLFTVINISFFKKE